MKNYNGYSVSDNNVEAKGVAGCLTLFIMFIFFPALYFLCGWVNGWLLKITIGNICIDAFNMTFRTSFDKYDLPTICATLGWVGSFFKSPFINTKKLFS